MHFHEQNHREQIPRCQHPAESHYGPHSMGNDELLLSWNHYCPVNDSLTGGNRLF